MHVFNLVETRSEPEVRDARGILVVESDARFGAAVAALLEASGLRVDRARTRFPAGPFAAVLVDIGARDAYAVVRSVAASASGAPILVIADASDAEIVLAAIRAGAQGFLVRRDVARRLVPALDELLLGGAPLSREAGKALVASLRAGEPPRSGVHETIVLTPREHDVLRELAKGLTYEQVALALDVSVNTVRTRVKAIYEKLGASTRTEAVVTAMQHGLLAAG